MTSTLSGLEIFTGSSYKGSIFPTVAKIVRAIGSFEKSRVREIGDEIIEHECRKINGNKVWYREVRETTVFMSTVFMSLNLLFRLYTRNGAIMNKNSQKF